MKKYQFIVRFLVVIGFLGWADSSHGTGLFSFGDTEKPNPEFQRSGQEITAKLIPRAKSTSVVISFGVPVGGTLEDVKGIDFYAVERPEVDVKNFKSAVFEIHITHVKPGETTQLSVHSDFFTQSTSFYIFNPRQEKWWKDFHIVNRSMVGRIRELVIPVRDGSDLDADGRADGQVTIIGGPRDSFWGYALGTLFIRFFGIFIVLSILMIGMIMSGSVFKALDRIKKSRNNDQTDPVKPVIEEKSAVPSFKIDAAHSNEVPDDVAVAIGVSLHLHLASSSKPDRHREATLHDSAWASEGRRRMMNDRFSVFNRFNQ